MDESRLDKLALELGARLKAGALQLSTAESCTGGWVAQVLTSIAGSSEWFERGFVSYSNESKREMLGVSVNTLERFGAVSEETAREMARGALKASRAGIALSITGIAGPGGGSPGKPVGTVCLAWADEALEKSETRHFTGDRRSVRLQSAIRALEGLAEMLDARRSP